MVYSNKKRSGFLASLLALAGVGCWCAPAIAQSDSILDRVSSSPIQQHSASVLVNSDVPLTQEMVERYNLLFEWLLDVQTTQEQRQIIKTYLIQSFEANSKPDMDNAQIVVNAQKQIEQRNPQEKELLRQTLQSQFLEALRKQPDNPATKWVFGIYDTAHKPIAQGTPPLTRQMSDAFLEVLCFMRNQVVGGTQISPNITMKDIFVKSVVDMYGKSDAVRQKHIAGMPLFWAALRSEWPKLADSEKAKYKEQWRGYLQQMAPEFLTWKPAQAAPQPQTASNLSEAEKRARAQAWYNQEMSRLQSSHSTYMMMSNMSLMNHVTNMNAISNIGNSGWHYEYKYK